MFKIAKSEFFISEVEIPTPDDKGRILKETVRVKFKRLNQEELDAIKDQSNVEVCREVILDVQDMVDDNGQRVVWDESIKEAFMSIPQATLACAAKFWILSRVGREKN